VILIGKDGDGKIVFLESGNARAGLQHVMVHADQFTGFGVRGDKVGQFVFEGRPCRWPSRSEVTALS
jgi:hypothetical protein